MTLSELEATLPDTDPPVELSDELRALWHDARGDWERAHETVQNLSTPAAAWVHAYLHRKEGDPTNARYWYIQAERPVFTGGLGAEWDQIARTLLDDLTDA